MSDDIEQSKRERLAAALAISGGVILFAILCLWFVGWL